MRPLHAILLASLVATAFVPPAEARRSGDQLAQLQMRSAGGPHQPSEFAELRQTGGDAPVLSLDDGTSEGSFGITAQTPNGLRGNQAVFLNRFTPAENLLPFSVDTVAILFPLSDEGGSTGLSNGMAFDVLVFLDPTGSGDADHTTLVAQQRIALAPSNTAFQVVRLTTPIVVESGDIWVGFTNTVTASNNLPIFPAAADLSGARRGRSFAFFNGAAGSHFGGPVLADADVQVQLEGNWLIRLSGQIGGLTSVCWSAPSGARGGLPPPTNTRICDSVPPLPKDEFATELQSPVRGYNVYRSNQPGVQPTASNFFTSTPPGQTTTNSSVSPGGSFFVITAMYDEGESGPSDELAVVPATINNVKVKANKIAAKGANFTPGVQIFLDGIPFVAPAILKKNNTKAVQKGVLVTGQTVGQYISSQGGRAKAIFRNSNGAFTAVDVTF